MKRTLTILILTLTSSIANIDNHSVPMNLKGIDTDKIFEITTKEICTPRNVRLSREVRKKREISSLRLSRESRKIRENRFTIQETRTSREVCHLVTQDTLYLANLK